MYGKLGYTNEGNSEYDATRVPRGPRVHQGRGYHLRQYLCLQKITSSFVDKPTWTHSLLMISGNNQISVPAYIFRSKLFSRKSNDQSELTQNRAK